MLGHLQVQQWPGLSPLYTILAQGLTLRPTKNGRQFADDPFKCIFLDKNIWISINISLEIVPKGSINTIPALVRKMTWRRQGHKPLFEPMMVTQWVCATHNSSRPETIWWQIGRWLLRENSRKLLKFPDGKSTFAYTIPWYQRRNTITLKPMMTHFVDKIWWLVSRGSRKCIVTLCGHYDQGIPHGYVQSMVSWYLSLLIISVTANLKLK